jgi:Zn2+/Cd2+-exporting ATPase
MNSARSAADTPGAVLSVDERQEAAQLLTLAMIALGLFALGLIWKFTNPASVSVSELLLGAASLMVAVPVLKAGWHSLLHPDLHGVTDLLIAVAMLGAWALGDLMTAVLLPVIMIFGHVLEERSVIGSHEAIAALGRLTHSRARLLTSDGTFVEVDNVTLKSGDRVEVRAGDRVPADGRVLEGRASLDTASITGESVPIEVVTGMEVYGGTIDLDGVLLLEVTRTGGESTLGKVIALMQRAERSKPPITRWLERYATQYLVLVLLISAMTWFLTGSAQAMLAVLVAACPCALALAAPATAIAGIAVGARHGILIRGSAFLEELADTTALVVDKTGTLTSGILTLQEVNLYNKSDSALVHRLAGSLGAASSHPVSRALAAVVAHPERISLDNIHERPGLGVVADTAQGPAVLGRPELFEQLSIKMPDVPVHDGPIAGLALGNTFMAWLLLADTPRREASAAGGFTRSGTGPPDPAHRRSLECRRGLGPVARYPRVSGAGAAGG